MTTAKTPAKKAATSGEAHSAKTETKAKAPAKKAEAPKVEAKKPAAKKEVSAGKVKITQMVGSIARKWDQEATLKGLGLGKRHRSRVLEDTPSVRGMINKVQHLVKVEKAS